MAPTIIVRKSRVASKSIGVRPVISFKINPVRVTLHKKIISRKTIARLSTPVPSVIQSKASFDLFLNPIILNPQLAPIKTYTTEEESTCLSGSSSSTEHSFSIHNRLGDPWLIEENSNLLLCEFVIIKHSFRCLQEEKIIMSVYIEENEDQIIALQSACKDVIHEADQRYIRNKLNSLVDFNPSICSEITFGERLYHCTTTATDRAAATAQLTLNIYNHNSVF